jgi:hypothetical protein
VQGGTENGADASPQPAAPSPPLRLPPDCRGRRGCGCGWTPRWPAREPWTGGWWPRSRDLDAELPGLVAGLDSSLGPITRVALNLDAWDTAPRRVAVEGRRVRVGWFRHMDAHTIGVTRAAQDRVVLLVVPPEATSAAAGIAMAMAADAADSAGAADILAAAGISVQVPP